MQDSEPSANLADKPRTHQTRLRRVLKSLSRILLTVVGAVAIIWIIIAQPTFQKNSASRFTASSDLLRAHVMALSSEFYPRDWENRKNLYRCADYIMSNLSNAADSAEFQVFKVHGHDYRNVIARFGTGKGSKVIVGAHYDTCGDTPGADDNASGVAALLELARLFGDYPPGREVELVAYSLEEPPFFRTPNMGSAVHAASVSNETITGVIILETMGFFSEERGSQSYPSLLLRLIYPSRGNFIAVVGPWNQGDWIKDVKAGMKGTTSLPVYSIRAPAAVPGIDLSDHMNYWPYGINAVMITDTAFYRNKAYHTLNDTADNLDYDALSKAVIGVFEAIGHADAE